MAISFVSSHSATGGSASASIAVPAAATSGRVGLLIISTSSGGTYTPPSGWTLVREQSWWFAGRWTRIYRKVFGSSESGSYTTAVSFGFWAVGLLIFDGVDTTAPVEASSSGNGFGTTHATGSVTAGGADRVLVGVWAASENAQVVTLPGTMTSRLTVAGGSAGQRIYVGTEAVGAGSYSRTGTTASNDDYAAYLIALTPAASGPAPVDGTLSVTLAGVTLSAAGTVVGPGAVAGTLAATLDGVSLSASGTVGPAPVAGTLSVTLDGVTLSAAGTVGGTPAPVDGSLSVTLDGVSLSAAGTVAGPEAITGTLAATLAGVTLSAAGTVAGPGAVAGSLSATLAGMTLSAAGTVAGGTVLPPSRAEIVADVTHPTFAVEVWTGSAWLAVAEHVTAARATIDAQGGAEGAAPMGPNVTPTAEVELAVAGWAQAGNRTPVRISFGFAASATVVRFGGIVTGRSRGPRYGRWDLRGWDAHIEGQEVRSPLLKRRPAATATSLTSVEDPSLSTYRAGLINYILWASGGRPYEQRLSYPSAVFYYRCATALIGPEYTWSPGDSPWEMIRRLCRATGGQLYQDTEGTVCYVDPITLATGTPAFTFSDEELTQEQRAAQGKAGYEDIQLDINALAAVTGVSCTFVGRRVQGEQTVYEDATPRPIAAGATLTLNCDTQLPLYSLGRATVDACVTRTATAPTSSQVTVSATLSSAQRVAVTITNTLTEPVIVDALKISGRPVSAGEEGSASYSAGSGRVVSVEDSPYVQSERHAQQLCRMVYDAEANGGELYTLSGCGYDPDRAVGEIVGLTSSEFGLTALRCRIVRIDTDGVWMDVVLAPLGSLPTRDSVHIIGAVSGTKELAY